MERLFKYFNGILNTQNDSAQNDILRALFNLIHANVPYLDQLMQSIKARRIVQLILSEKTETQIGAIRVIGELCGVSDTFIDKFVEGGCLPVLRHVAVRKGEVWAAREACWALSNIAFSTTVHVQQLIGAGVVKAMQGIVNEDYDSKIKEEAIWTLTNVCFVGNSVQLQYLMNEGILSELAFMIDKVSPKLLKQVLEAVEKLLRLGSVSKVNKVADEWMAIGGVEKMERLQEHANGEIANLVLTVLERYYQLEMIN
eukprot:TRINITY_DN3784_c0_g1_i16.p1 TRINITY_DN3784_c0_g1~~TRINITY_DN3784_c0_g1_i16.p1  ORF type:complete len:256 (+),score=64.29 TRINITY_DN3784_c0_g1_i16:291-1058(+)